MGIFSRLTDIINANINSLLDKAEDPEKIVRLMIQEMEDTLVEVRSTAAKAIADKKERSRALNYLEQEAIDWEQKAELALRKDRDDLAKAALVEKTKVNERIEALKKEVGAINDHLEKLNEDISKLQAKLNDAKNRQRTLAMRHKAAHSQLKVRNQIHGTKIDDVLNRFENAERKIDEVESEAESLDMGQNRTLSDEILDLERGEQIEAELSSLKKRVAKGESKSKD
ncbi:MAG: phage shock protein PspA [Xanthomonadales bacterium]|nr:phage shock protein PspA [Xanthomonadales bacterium]